MATYKLPKDPEQIKIAHAVAPEVFYDSTDDYEPIAFDSSTLEYNYGDQIFFDVAENKNLVFLSEALTGDCLLEMNEFVNNPAVIWKNSMITSYLSLNSHYGSAFQTAVTTLLDEWFDESYVMPDASTNYYDEFGPSGLNKTTADWFLVMRFDGDITSRTTNKTGDTLKWQLDDSVYDQNNLPSHTLGAGDGWCLVSTTDGWTGVTLFAVNTNNFTSFIPNFDFPNAVNLFLRLNDFEGDISVWSTNLESNTVLQSLFADDQSLSGDLTTWDTAFSNMPDLNVIQMDNNDFTGLFVPNSVGLQTYNMQNNNVGTSGLDAFLSGLNTFYASNAPTSDLNVTISGGTMGIPTGGNSNTDRLAIIATFVTAGHTATITNNT
jgi:hypothetical protein